MENGKEGAFACPDNGTESFTTWFGQKGLTKREYFAGLAMQGMIANRDTADYGYEEISKWSIRYADELLKQLEQ